MTRKSAIYNYAATLDDACRDAYQLYLEQWLFAAEEATNGVLVNARGRALGFHATALITGPGHHKRRVAYATDEMRDYFARNPMLTYQQFEAQWLREHTAGAA